MKNFSFFFNFFNLLILLILLSPAAFLVSCGSAPPPVPTPEPVAPAPPPPEPAPVPESAPPPVVEETPPAGPTAQERYAELLPRVDEARQTALAMGADETNPDGLSAAEDRAALGHDRAENDDYEAAITSLEEAITLFEKAASDAEAEWERRTEEAKLAADGQKAAADEVKAGNAAKPEYAEANRYYENAAGARRARDYRKAIGEYGLAASQFAAAAQIASDKRDAAAAVLQAAEKKIAESDDLASEVEQTLLSEGDD